MLGRLLVISGLTGLVVVQPILDLLGKNPVTFDQNGVEGRAILVFAALLVVVPALVVWLIGELTRAVDERGGEAVHLASVGLLAGGFGVLLAKSGSDLALLNVAIGVAVGVGVVLLYRRGEVMGMWLRLMAAANLLFLAQFAFFSPAADWVESATATPEILAPIEPVDRTTSAAGDAEAAADTEPEDLTPPSVFILVFDELPTQTLLNDDAMIDSERYPTFAAFAEEATWFRRHTTNSPFTHAAIPSLLDGKEPQGGPTWTEHPENLFNVFAGSHHLVVSEVLTRLCGFDVCSSLTPPPPPPPTPATGDTGDSAATTTSTTAPAPTVEAPAEPSARWGDLLATTWDVWVDRLSPSPGTGAQGLDDFQEDFGVVAPATSTTTTAPPPTTTTTTAAPEADSEPAAPTLTVPNDTRSEEDQALARFFQMLPGAQPDRLTEFLAAVRPSSMPVFGYLHLMLPHQPWVVRGDGTLFDLTDDRYDHEADNKEPWPTFVNHQRHVLQTQYTDRVLGQFLTHLQENGYYDDSLIVVVGDHGVSFEPGDLSRTLSPDGLPSIAYTPLLIKAPGQTTGMVDDQNMTITDISVTMADLLGIGLPWETSGVAAGSDEMAARGREKRIYEFTSATGFNTPPTIAFDDEEAFGRLMAGRFPSLIPGADELAPLYAGLPGDELRGAAADDVFGLGRGDAVVDSLDRLVDPGDEPLLGEVAGRVPGAPDDAIVVVAVNDVIVGVSPLYRRSGADDSFVVLLPAGALEPADNTVRVGLLGADGDVVERNVEG